MHLQDTHFFELYMRKRVSGRDKPLANVDPRSNIWELASKAFLVRKAKALRVGEGMRPRDEKLRKRKYSK